MAAERLAPAAWEEEEEGEGEGKRGTVGAKKRKRYGLVEYRALPGYLRDNEYIHRHYRCEWPLPQVLLSAFSIHNETLNVWTHLIGFFIFLALTIYTATQVPNVVDIQSLQHLPDVLRNADIHKIQAELVSCLPSLPHLSDLQKLKDELKSSWDSMEVLPYLSRWHLLELLSNCLPHRFTHSNETNLSVLVSNLLKLSFLFHIATRILLQSMKAEIANMIAPQLIRPIARWPFFAFLGGAMFCLLASSTCHLLSCHSRRLAYIMLRLDYAGIAALIATSFYPPVYYSFMCYPFFCNLYLSFITILGVATIAFSLLPVFQNPEFRTIRACLFFGMGASGVIPVLHKLVLFWHQPEALYTTGYEVLMGLFYGLGALVYATRVPERWMPGKFDIAGHSHQLFHVLVVAGAYTHYHTGLVYLKWRDLQGC
ncbi:Heptahelical transmembrane protein ADIPOR3 [Dichanthelium oligosanthes]|uniref:Heptahelical transmembrane protein ADIPOR3 n=1 Tax=Dichanthelium oligosanthes TaxID=888268 RepID=A0A1E5WGM8_9POAL|nr:Heptahelical transmembrane protein ADIPOR3 [Dichanthelium oligosanthes]